MSSTRTVASQAELDTALADDTVTTIVIRSPRGVWLRLTSYGSATVEAYGSATVEATGSATVRAYGSATVRATGSATVRATGSATVEATGSATVEATGSATVRAYGSATVEAYGSATVEAYGSATVRAYGSATVEATGSATVWATGSATVRAYGSATVEAYVSATVEATGSATVRAYGSATVRASSHVAVHLHSARATVTGGAVIDVAALNLTDARTWAEYHGVALEQAADLTVAVLYKAADGELTAGRNYNRPTVYTVGTTVTCDDWRDDDNCGGGLHVSPRPAQAAGYARTDPLRYLRVHVPLDGLRPLGSDKCKTPTLYVAAEVDAHGADIEVPA